MNQIITTGQQVSFYAGQYLVEGEVEAIAGAQPEVKFHRYCSYKVNGQWYSDPQFFQSLESAFITKESNLVRAVDQFYKIPVTLPKYWLKMICYYNRQCRYVAIYYSAGKAVWRSGHSMATFSYFAAYEPMIGHPAIALHLAGLDLGTDDSEAEYSLIMDCNDPGNIELYIAPFARGLKFVCDSAPELPPLKLTDEELEEFLKKYHKEMVTVGQMQQHGMLEMFLGHSSEQYRLRESMIQHLNKQLDGWTNWRLMIAKVREYSLQNLWKLL